MDCFYHEMLVLQIVEDLLCSSKNFAWQALPFLESQSPLRFAYSGMSKPTPFFFLPALLLLVLTHPH